MAIPSQLVPLFLLFFVLAVLTIVGLVVYSIVSKVKAETARKMERNHVTLTRDGVKVAVKEFKDEEYKDRTQSVLVDIWNHGIFGTAWLSQSKENGTTQGQWRKRQ